MSNRTLKLTQTVVDSAPIEQARYVIWDHELKGFGLRVSPLGTKTYFIRYRPKGGAPSSRKPYLTLGRATDVKLAAARDKARAIRGEVAFGGDPARERAHTQSAIKVQELIASYLADHVAPKRKPATLAQYRHFLEMHVAPKLGSRVASDLTPQDISKLHRSLSDRPATANRAVAVVAAMWSWGMKVHLLPDMKNPAAGIEKYREQSRERFLSAAEIGRLMAALTKAEREGFPWQPDEGPNQKHAPSPENRVVRISPYAAAAIRLLVLTGARLREILHLKWEYVDLMRCQARLPDSKTGPKTIYLSKQAVSIIEQLRDLGNAGPYIIASENGAKPRADLKRPWSLVTREANLPKLRIHDLRHTFASAAVASGHSLPIVGHLLGHTQARTTQKYAHLSESPLSQAVNAIGDALNVEKKISEGL